MTDAPTPAAGAAPGAAKPAAKQAAKAGAKPAAKPGARPAARAKPAPKPPKPRRALIRPGLLPATIFVATLVLGFKVGDIWLTVTTGKGLSLIPTSIAEEAAPQGLPETKQANAVTVAPAKPAVAPAGLPAASVQVAEAEQQHAQTPPAAGGEHGQPAAAAGDHAQAPATAPAADPNSPAPSGAPGQGFTPTEVEILQRLQERREQLDSRGRELDQREAMLTAAETRFDQKITELQNLKKEIQGLLTQANAEQQAQLDSLVKIYETMKPADAAKIFNNLENDVLLNVISRMKEAKVAPVFAAMDEKRAQEVTILLAARKRLPTVPE
jgi:flagellar motility protein MotE (MotC chaperone)